MQDLADKAVSASPTRMGRPPLGIKATQVRLTQAVMDRIDRLMGPNRRAQFIREAVERELERREKSGG